MWVTFVGELTGNSANVELFRFTGPGLDDVWDISQVAAARAGSASLIFLSPAAASFNYTLDAISGSLDLQPFTLGNGSAGAFSGTWWDPDKSGQAVTLLHDGEDLAGAWYFYDPNGNGMWITFTGSLAGATASVDLLRFSGPALGSVWDESQVLPAIIGSGGLAFSAPDSAAFSYTVNGIAGALTLRPFDLQPPDCADIAGTWSGTETIALTCTAAGENLSEMISDSGTIIITQTGCDVGFTLPGFNLGRTGQVQGNTMSFSGPFLVPLLEGIMFDSNSMTALGTVNGDQISLSGTGSATGTVEGLSATCTGTSTASFTRSDNAGPCADSAGLYQGSYSESFCDGQHYDGFFAAIVRADNCAIQFVSDSGSFGSGSVSGNAFTITAAAAECGTISGNGTISGSTVSGSYSYSAGGGGGFSGSKH
jgi:hypothetical protein